jgi:hypothetical protein
VHYRCDGSGVVINIRKRESTAIYTIYMYMSLVGNRYLTANSSRHPGTSNPADTLFYSHSTRFLLSLEVLLKKKNDIKAS